MKKALFLSLLRSLSITYLITLSLEKESIVLLKSLENSLEFWIPKSVQTLHIYKWLDFLGVRFFRRIQKRVCDLVWILHQQNREDPKKDHLPR